MPTKHRDKHDNKRDHRSKHNEHVHGREHQHEREPHHNGHGHEPHNNGHHHNENDPHHGHHHNEHVHEPNHKSHYLHGDNQQDMYQEENDPTDNTTNVIDQSQTDNITPTLAQPSAKTVILTTKYKQYYCYRETHPGAGVCQCDICLTLKSKEPSEDRKVSCPSDRWECAQDHCCNGQCQSQPVCGLPDPKLCLTIAGTRPTSVKWSITRPHIDCSYPLSIFNNLETLNELIRVTNNKAEIDEVMTYFCSLPNDNCDSDKVSINLNSHSPEGRARSAPTTLRSSRSGPRTQSV